MCQSTRAVLSITDSIYLLVDSSESRQGSSKVLLFRVSCGLSNSMMIYLALDAKSIILLGVNRHSVFTIPGVEEVLVT